jgi:tRNA dimethylallyltransferase
MNNKIIVILGPTSSGKSDVAIKLAQKFNGEILSADSRQIYREMDIGSGKEPGRWNAKKKYYLSSDIPHYGIDIVSPRTDYNSAKFKKYADKIIVDILSRGKIPIICGGTGFWIKAIVDDVVYPEVKPNWLLRNKLSNKSTMELFNMLKKLDPTRAKNIDAKNPMRLIRAIEICKKLGSVPKPNQGSTLKITKVEPWEFIQIGISTPKEKIAQRIKARLQKRFKAGMVREVATLYTKNNLSWKRLESFGLGYSLIPKYLKCEIKSKEELFEKVYLAEKNYAKRQMTWFSKDKRIVWLEKYREIEKEVKKFLKF